MKNNYLKYKLTSFLLLLSVVLFSQNVNLEQVVTGKPFKVNGSVSANTIFFNSNQESGRDPFTYFAQEVINFSFYQFSMPVTYSYSNQGDNLDYQIPFKFNRLSLHPKYKWVQAHIGDVSMTFSPYTLSAHQFTGGGLELSPKGGFKFAAMSGRLLKATEDDVIFLKGFQSASESIETPLFFLRTYPKEYQVVFKMKSKAGVFIDDIADYGETLGHINPLNLELAEQIQLEVLLDEGYFRITKLPEPKVYGGQNYIEIEIEQLLSPILRTIE